VAERGIGGRTWTHSMQIGTGAAAGRLVASIVKGGVTGAVGAALTIAAFWP
jgi:hypothetical protein